MGQMARGELILYNKLLLIITRRMTKKEIIENIKLMKQLENKIESYRMQLGNMRDEIDESNKMKSEIMKRFPALLLKPSI
jgi:hypothetical protein